MFQLKLCLELEIRHSLFHNNLSKEAHHDACHAKQKITISCRVYYSSLLGEGN